MKRHLIALAAMLVSSVAMSVPAQAQYVMDWNAGNALVMSSIQNDSLNRERERADLERQQSGQRDRRSSTTAPTSPRPMMDRTFDAAFAALNPEFQRRTRIYGKPAAAQWLNAAAGDLGKQLGAMASEYRRRVRTDGNWNAERWYVDQARLAGQQYARDAASR